MLNGRGKEMKEYKIDLHEFEGKVREVVNEAIQEKAFELGCWWFGVPEKRAIHKSASFIFTHKDGSLSMRKDSDASWFNNHSNTLISAADFLALTPEDVQDKPKAPKEPEFKPFDRVLVRDYDNDAWIANIYTYRDENCTFIHQTLNGVGYHQCISYEGNEHLLGTKENVE